MALQEKPKFIQCPYCQEEILAGAIKCKHCGSSIGGKRTYSDYSQVPWYRKNWFAFLTFFFFAPALFVLVVSGDIYYKSGGMVKAYSKAARILLGLFCFIPFIWVIYVLF